MTNIEATIRNLPEGSLVKHIRRFDASCVLEHYFVVLGIERYDIGETEPNKWWMFKVFSLYFDDIDFESDNIVDQIGHVLVSYTDELEIIL